MSEARSDSQAAPVRAVLLAAYAMISLAPVIYMVLTAFKLPADTAALPPRFLPGLTAPENSFWFRFTFANFHRILSDSETLRYLFNSVFISLCDVTGSGEAANFDRPRLSAALTPPTVELTSSAISSSV